MCESREQREFPVDWMNTTKLVCTPHSSAKTIDDSPGLSAAACTLTSTWLPFGWGRSTISFLRCSRGDPGLVRIQAAAFSVEEEDVMASKRGMVRVSVAAEAVKVKMYRER